MSRVGSSPAITLTPPRTLTWAVAGSGRRRASADVAHGNRHPDYIVFGQHLHSSAHAHRPWHERQLRALGMPQGLLHVHIFRDVLQEQRIRLHITQCGNLLLGTDHPDERGISLQRRHLHVGSSHY